MKWEYKVKVRSIKFLTQMDYGLDALMEGTIKNEGSDGWELSLINEVKDCLVFVFKRQVKEEFNKEFY